MTAKEELIGAIRWQLDISEDNATYLVQLIMNAVENEFNSQAGGSVPRKLVRR